MDTARPDLEEVIAHWMPLCDQAVACVTDDHKMVAVLYRQATGTDSEDRPDGPGEEPAEWYLAFCSDAERGIALGPYETREDAVAEASGRIIEREGWVG